MMKLSIFGLLTLFLLNPIINPNQPPRDVYPRPMKVLTNNSWVECYQLGNNGWCTGSDRLNMEVSTVSGQVISSVQLTFNGTVNEFVSSPVGGFAANIGLPDGSGPIVVRAVNGTTGEVRIVNTSWKRDTVWPTVSLVLPPAFPGTSNCYNGSVFASVNGSDATSGIYLAQLSYDNGATYQNTATILGEGTKTIWYKAEDNAGHQTGVSARNIRIDLTAPTYISNTTGTLGNADWYRSATATTLNVTDNLCGVGSVEYSQNGGVWISGSSYTTTTEGVNVIDLTFKDVVNNTSTGTNTIKIDTVDPLLTPSITGTSGANGWLVSNAFVSASASDATSGIDGNVQVTFNSGTTWQSVPTSLGEGVYNMLFQVFDVAGNDSVASRSVSIDTTPPSLNLVYNGTVGENGWYISSVDVSTNASDALSGLDHSEISVNSGSWLPSVTLSDGVHNLDANAADIAGNTRSTSGTLRIDSTSPVSSITSHSNGQVLSGIVMLGGQSNDVTSGLQYAELSFDEGATWQPANEVGNAWSYELDTTGFLDGSYIVKVRGVDNAGNRESPVDLNFVVDNNPPSVDITDSWWIWESGEFNVQVFTFPIQQLTVTISDPEDRWDDVVIVYDPNLTTSNVTWDRRFPGNVIAPFGDYPVTAEVCDIHGLCGTDQGTIHVLFVVPDTATPAPPTTTPTSAPPTLTRTPVPPSITPTASAIVLFSAQNPTQTPGILNSLVTATATATPTNSPAPTQELPSPTPVVLAPVSQPRTIVSAASAGMLRHSFLTLLAVLTFLAMMWITSSASVADRRPDAILRIAETVNNTRN